MSLEHDVTDSLCTGSALELCLTCTNNHATTLDVFYGWWQNGCCITAERHAQHAQRPRPRPDDHVGIVKKHRALFTERAWILHCWLLKPIHKTSTFLQCLSSCQGSTDLMPNLARSVPAPLAARLSEYPSVIFPTSATSAYKVLSASALQLHQPCWGHP